MRTTPALAARGQQGFAANQQTVLRLKLRLFLLMLLQFVGFGALLFSPATGINNAFLRALVLAGGFFAYLYLASQIYLGKSSAKRWLTYITGGLIVYSLLIPIVYRLLQGLSNLPSTLAVDSASVRLAVAGNIFMLENLWPSLCIVFASALILNMLARHTVLKLWDSSASGEREYSVPRLSLGNGLVLACLLWLCFYALLVALPENETTLAIRKLFFGDHPIYYFMALIFFWAMALIIGDYLIVRDEQEVFGRIRGMFQRHTYKQIRESEAASLMGQVERVARPITHSWASYRVYSLLQAIMQGKGDDLAEVEQRLDLIEFQAAENARNFISTLLWSLPLLGFLGTILGVIAAVGGFSDVITGGGDTAQLTESLSGLSLAFETTLLGLLGSLVGAYAFALVRRNDEQLNVALAQLCNQEILAKVAAARPDSFRGGEA